jgi:molybdopterin converting factor small subunit
MKANEAIKQIKTLLGLETEVKLAQARLLDGTTVIEAEVFEAGMEVFIVTEEGNVPMPVGEYEMEGGELILVVEEEGIIAEIKEKVEETEEEEEAPAPEAETEVVEEEMSEETRQPKKTIESIIKETLFSEIEKIKAENEELKAELAALKNATELSAVEDIKPIQYNPENEQKAEVFKYAKNRSMSSLDRVLNKLK